MEIFKITKTFPKEERYFYPVKYDFYMGTISSITTYLIQIISRGETDQIRRSSRSITANITEAWAKRIYIKSFVHKLSDSLGEEFETEGWLDYSKDCEYIDKEDYSKLILGYDEVRKMLISMMNSPKKFCKNNSPR